MGGIKHAVVGLSTPRVRGDEGGPVKDAHVVDVDRHVDVLTNERVRHASIQQTQRYLNVTDEELRKGLEVSWGRQLRAVSGQ